MRRSQLFVAFALLVTGCGSKPLIDKTDNSVTTIHSYCTVQLEPRLVDAAGLEAIEADDETEILSISQSGENTYSVDVCIYDLSNQDNDDGAFTASPEIGA